MLLERLSFPAFLCLAPNTYYRTSCQFIPCIDHFTISFINETHVSIEALWIHVAGGIGVSTNSSTWPMPPDVLGVISQECGRGVGEHPLALLYVLFAYRLVLCFHVFLLSNVYIIIYIG